MENFNIDEKLSKLLNNIVGWSQSIRIEAWRTKNDGIDDDGLIIQELIEDYIHNQGINPRKIIDYEKYNIRGKRRYDK
jgi:hypothetical protein